MPKVKSLTASRGRAVPVEQYGGKTEAFASVTLELEPGDKWDEVMALAQAMANVSVATQFRVVENGVLPEVAPALVEAVMRMQTKVNKGEVDMPIARARKRTRAYFPVLGDARKGLPKPERGPGRNSPYFRVELKDPALQVKFDTMYNQTTTDGKIVGPQVIPCMVLSEDIDEIIAGWFEMHNGAGERTHRCDGELIKEPYDMAGEPCELRNLPRWKKRGDAYRCEPVIKMYVMPYELGAYGQLRVRSHSEEDYRTLCGQLEGIKSFAGRLTNVPLLIRRAERGIKNPDTGKRVMHWQIEVVVDMDKYDPNAEPSAAPAAAPPGVDPETGEIYDDAPSTPAPWWGNAPPPAMKKPRPWTPEDTRGALRTKAYLRDISDKPSPRPDADEVARVLDGKLEAGSQHAVILQAFDCDHTKELTDGQLQSLVGWLSSENTSQDEVNALAAKWWLTNHRDLCSEANANNPSVAAKDFAAQGRSPDDVPRPPAPDSEQDEMPF